MSSAWRRIDPALAAVTVLGLVLASYRIGAKSLVLDESTSVWLAGGGLHGLWKILSGGDANAKLYYTLLDPWLGVLGDGEAAARSLSAVAAGLAVLVVALLGNRLFGRTAGLVAGLLLAMDAFFVQYAQTARTYALVVCSSRSRPGAATPDLARCQEVGCSARDAAPARERAGRSVRPRRRSAALPSRVGVSLPGSGPGAVGVIDRLHGGASRLVGRAAVVAREQGVHRQPQPLLERHPGLVAQCPSRLPDVGP
jgi:hypothetical protein